MATTTDLGRVREKSTGQYTATLADELEVVIPLASLTTLKLTLYDVATGTILNTRNLQDVLNANNVTYHGTSGLLTWSVQPADHAIVSTRGQIAERHRAVFDFTWNAGAKRDWHAVEFLVEADPKVS
jgi:hypothetical protein